MASQGLSSQAVAPRALLVDDDPSHLEAMQALVEQQGFATRTATSLATARSVLEKENFDLLITDVHLPDGESMELLDLMEQRPVMDVVFVTGRGSVDAAVRAIRSGVADYLTKPIDVRRLEKVLTHVERAVKLRGQVGELQKQLRVLGRFGRMIGASAPMQAVYDQIQKVSRTDATVLVAGETGTGKELVAETLHELSERADAPFVPLNCGAISPNLIESELFGHEKGSFTGATERRFGCFERADGGTLFLDEITEMSADLQVKLLRALESSTVQRVGGSEPIPVDVRVIAATNRDPHPAVADGTLREDLLYRLLVFPIHLPPLRSREDDLDLLADYFLAQHNRRAGTHKELTRAARERLRRHSWPGNVRELRNVIERAFIVAETDLDAECISLAGAAAVPTGVDGAENLGVRVGMSNAEVERILTLATLDHYGEKKRTADVLGISLKTLYNRLKSYKEEE
jgi:two-component system response regulator AtoC